MHPAKSIIAFTSLSGLGFGFMAFIGLGYPQVMGWGAFFVAAVAMGLAGIGLLASLLHLGNPQRFLKAFSQVRTSWLSREAVLSVATLMVFAANVGLLVLGTRVAVLGYLSAVLAFLTIACTAMIYAQLRTVPRWHTWLTPVLFITYGLNGGALLAGRSDAALVAAVAVLIVQVAHWARGRAALRRSGSTPGTATALGGIGSVRMLESPHTARNYVTSEMANKVAPTLVKRLKLGVLGLLVAQCLALALLPFGQIAAAGIILMHLGAVVWSRWLFFAESEHVVSLYYAD